MTTATTARAASPHHLSGKLAAGRMSASDADTQQQTRRMLGARLLALALAVYLAQLVLGLVKYILDVILCVFVLSGIAAFCNQGSKDSVIARALAWLETAVDPLFSGVADRVSISSGPLRRAASYLGISPGLHEHGFAGHKQ